MREPFQSDWVRLQPWIWWFCPGSFSLSLLILWYREVSWAEIHNIRSDLSLGECASALKEASVKTGTFLKRLMRFQPDVNILYPSYNKEPHLGPSFKLKPRGISKKKRNNVEILRWKNQLIFKNYFSFKISLCKKCWERSRMFLNSHLINWI